MKGKLSIFKSILILGALLVLLVSATSCSKKSGGSSDAGAGTGGGTGGGTASGITVLANPTSITANGTSTITATIKDSNGNLVADGTSVTFSLSSVAFGSLSNTTVTTAAGIATTTFTAGSVTGSVTITATSGGGSNTASLTVGTVSAGSIQFVSATPKILGIKGAGNSETSVIKFLVSDVNGNPVDGALVNFVMTGPNGGEFIGDIDSTPTTASAVTVSGIASVLLHSGTIAGTVNITASTTISNGPISTSATPLSIGGGVPSATHFSLAPKPFNLEGLLYHNLQSTVSAYVADRFGNYNVLDGTSVSFYTEAGAIDAQGITGVLLGTGETGIDATAGDTGAANVIFRTQFPWPQSVPPAVAGDAISMKYFGGLNEPFYTAGTVTFNPRNGWADIVAATKGEETFLDENLDGLFTRSYKNDKCPYSAGVICECDGGVTGGYAGFVLQGERCSDPGKPGGLRSEGFIDLPEDPFIDVNDDGLRDDGQTPGHPYEQFIDANGNGIFDGTNGKWDGPDCQTSGCEKNKTIWTDTKIVFSGPARFFPNPDGNNCYTVPACTTFAIGSFATATSSIARGSSGSFRVIVGDGNLNRLQAKTTITVTASAGSVNGLFTNYVVPDGLSTGPTTLNFTIAIDPTETAAETTVTITVVTPDGIITPTAITIPII
ncbi:MAG: invasin domain 3-containing protein [Nitrospirota bacterium]